MLTGTMTIRKMREVHQCNIPWLILMDPTSACNLHCTGCWAAEYGNKLNLTYEEMASVIRQGRSLGVYFYMFTGGEPLVRKKDVIRLCDEFDDCQFLAFTNGTLVDEAFCDEMKRVGNLMLAISLEGDPEVNDLRRGQGVYGKVMHAMDLLKQNGLIFGTSICYTAKNCMSVTSPEFVKLMVDNEENGIFWPQNSEYTNTSQMVAMIAAVHGKRMILVKGFSWALKILSRMTALVDKAFGSFCCDQEMSSYKQNYCIVNLSDSIKETEGIA